MKVKGTRRKKVTALAVLFATVLALFLVAAGGPEVAKADMVQAGKVYFEGVGWLEILYETGDGYVVGLDEHKNLTVTGTYHHNPEAELSYHTTYLYFTAEPSGGDPTSVGKTKYVEFEVKEHNEQRVSGSPNLIRDTFKVSVEALKAQVPKLFGDKDFEGPYTVYLSAGYVLKRRPGGVGDWKVDSAPVYSTLDGIRGAAGWTSITDANFARYFDAQIELDLEPIEDSVPVKPYKVTVDTYPSDGTGGTAGGGGEFYAGDTVSLWASANTDWMFSKWQGNTTGLNIKDLSAENISFTMPAHDVDLTAHFVEKAYTVTPEIQKKYKLTLNMSPKEGGSATGAGEYYADEMAKVQLTVNNGWKFAGWLGTEGLDIGRKATKFSFFMPARDVTLTARFVKQTEQVEPEPPTPTPTPTPTPMPTPVISQPQEDKIGYVENYRYYTTDKGYSIDALSQNVVLANRTGVDKGSASNMFRRNGTYSVGTDVAGNEWYFTPYGTEATYVHPKKYNGYEVAGSDVGKIMELTFPETVSCNGTAYTVTTIGGGLSWYNSMELYTKDPCSNLSFSSDGTGGGYEFSLKNTDGYYNYSWVYADNTNFEHTIFDSMQYQFGVVGNGSITSHGQVRQYWPRTGVEWRTDYASTYEVYNTTLGEITIPSTVRKIEDYAFANCNALTKINGGTGVQEIGRYAFMAGSAELKLSETGNNNSSRYYTYNESYTLTRPWTSVMLAYDTTRKLRSHMQLAAFPKLKTIQAYAFLDRANLHDVVLPKGVNAIREGAFKGCKLNSIEVPGMYTIIDGDRYTLGTKGYGTDESKTSIITEPESKAMYYGLEHVWYYKLRCGYDVTYDNNFPPEETYESRAELKEWIVDEKESVEAATLILNCDCWDVRQEGGGTVTLDTEGNVWYRGYKNPKSGYNNIIPQKLDFGSKVTELRQDVITKVYASYSYYWTNDYPISESGYVPAATATVMTENGDIYYYSGTTHDPSDSETPYKSNWTRLNTPEGVKSFQWVERTVELSDGMSEQSNSYSRGEWVTSESKESKLFYLTADGELEYLAVGEYTQQTGGEYGSSSGDVGTYPAAPPSCPSEVSTSRKRLKMPDGVRFEKLAIVPVSSGGSESWGKNNTSAYDYSRYEDSYVADLCLPTIYATATDGTVWMATAAKFSRQSYVSGYDSGNSYTSGSPIVEVTLSDTDYVWTRVEEQEGIVAYCTPGNKLGIVNQAGLSATIREDAYNLFYIKKNGALMYHDMTKVSDKHLAPEVTFSEFFTVNGYNFVIDETGYIWMLALKGHDPIRLFRDAEPTRIFEVAHHFYINSQFQLNQLQIKKYIYLSDSAGRLWETDISYFSESLGKLSPATLRLNAGSQVKKITYNQTVHYDFDNRTVEGYDISMLILCEDGSVWAYGSNSNETKWVPSYTAQGVAYAQKGYTAINGPEYYTSHINYSVTPAKVSGDHVFVEVKHMGNYSLAMDEYGNVYRTGYYHNTATGEITPAKYDGFTLVDEEMEYEGTSFVVGYHYVETLYDSMFERENHVFLHWNEQEDNSGDFLYPGEELVVETPVRLYAQWEKECNKVRYHPNGASGFMEDTVTDPPAGNTVTLRKNTYYMGGYVFNGWNTKPDGTGTVYADEAEFIMKKGTTVLFAMWKKADKYTLKVATEEEHVRPVEISSTHRLDYDEYFTMPEALADRVCFVEYELNKQNSMSTTPKWITATPFSDEYTTSWQEFLCWTLYEEEVVNSKYNFLYRMLAPGAKANRLTQHMDYASVLFPLWSGPESYVLLPEVSCDGYWLIGWAESATGKTGFVDAPEGSGAQYKPTKPRTTLYAYYEPKQYDIELVAAVEDAEPGDIIQEQTSVRMTFDAVLPQVIPPMSETYTFMGYYDKVDENGIPTEDAVMFYDETGAPAPDGEGNPMVWRIHDGSVTKLYAYLLSEVEVQLDGRGATKQEQTSVFMTYDQTGPDVIPPEKTGYTFGGYYTKIRGEGKQYFDADGHGSAVWREKKVRVLYAYWIQNEVKLPEKEEGKTPTPAPEDKVLIDAKLTGGVLQLYADDNDPSTGAETDQQPYLVADVRNGEKLVAAGAIPSTENVAMRAKLGAWLLRCSLAKKSGVDMVRVHVTVPYRTQYEKAEDESLVISKRQTKTVTVTVPKEWSYWILEEGGIYFPEKTVVRNNSITGGTVEVPVTWTTENAVKKPDYTITSYGEKNAHVSFVSYDADGTPSISVTAEEQYIVSKIPGKLPEVDAYLSVIAHNTAWSDTTQFTVKSDRLSVAGVTLLSDEKTNTGHGRIPQKEVLETIREKIAQTAYNQTYKSGIPLLLTVPNGRYDTEAYAVYRAGEGNRGGAAIIELPIVRTNEVNIHTPVVCMPKIFAYHDEMYQCKEVPEGSTVLVLDEEDRYSDFVLSVENTGYHSDKKGYRERNYTEFLSKKNGMVQNEVRFPFDLWMDTGNDGNKENDILLSAGEWYTVGTEKQRWYAPVWTEEGSYEVEFRSVAINGAGMEERAEWERNSCEENYVAVKTIKVYVTGRVYDFTVHEVKGTAVWNTATEKGVCYTVGTKPPEYSLWSTLPLRKGVHPQYRNLGGLPCGATIAFSVKSAGISCREEATVQAEPHLFTVVNGTCHEVDVYYEAETENGPVLKAWDPNEQGILLSGEEVRNGVLQWEGTFTLPEKLYITEKGTDVWTYRKQHGLSFTEDFWITDVPLMLRFGLQLETEKGELLYYGMIPEEIANNIWQKEAEVLYREDNDKSIFQIIGGETAVIYPGDSIMLGQTSYGIY